MSWYIGMLPPETSELGAVAHGPAILAQLPGVIIGLRTIMAYTSGLEIAVMVAASGAQASLVERQFVAPAEIDPSSGLPSRGPILGENLRLSAADDSTEQPTPRRNTAARSRSGFYRREYLFVTSELPTSSQLRYLIAWPSVGIRPFTVEVAIPEPEDIRRRIITLPH